MGITELQPKAELYNSLQYKYSTIAIYKGSLYIN